MLTKSLIAAAGNGQETADVAEAIDFDGTNDYLSRSSDLTGNTDGKTFTFSAWVWPNSSNILYDSGTGTSTRFRISLQSTSFILEAWDAAGPTKILDVSCVISSQATFFHLLVSIDLSSTANRYIYVNDVAATPIFWTTYSNANIDFTTAVHRLAAQSDASASQKTSGRFANVYLDKTYRNLSDVNNRRLFVTADLKPAAGQAALNPILYLPLDDPTNPGLNAGTGGNFTLTGVVARSGRGPNQYNAPYSDFDGSADYLSRTSIVGIADGNQFTFACNVQADTFPTNAAPLSLESDFGNIFSIRISATGLIINCAGLSGSQVLYASFTSTFVAGRNYNVVISVNLTSSALRKVFINGVDYTSSFTWVIYDNFNIGFSTPPGKTWYVGGSGRWDGRLGALWFNTSYIDLSVAANLAKFVTGTGIDAKPADLGANGELPTGSSPLIYLPMYGNNAGLNKGTGGNFTVNSGPYTGARGPNEFWGNKADFNGTSGYIQRSSALTGLTTSRTFSASFYINKDTTAQQTILRMETSGAGYTGVNLQINASNQLLIYGSSTASANRLSATVTSPTLSNATDYYVQICVDLTNTSKRAVYINGAAATVTWSTYSNADIGFNTTAVVAFGVLSGAEWLNGRLAEFYFTTEYIDFSQEANRLKFRDAFGKPVDLTQQIEDAAIPNPAIYMRFPPTSFGTNSGTGGNFSYVDSSISDGGQL